MWLDNLKELKKKTEMTAKQIADKTNLPERTVSRIFSGDTDAPRVDTLRRIVAVLGGSLDDLFAESGSVVANTDLVALQAEYDKLNGELQALQAENNDLKVQVCTLMRENEQLSLQLAHKDEILAHKDEIIAIHNHYNKLKTND